MTTFIGSLLAYDEDGHVIATLDHLVVGDPETGEALGLADFAAHEEAGRELTDIWSVSGARGSKVWPQWLGERAREFRVEREGPDGNKRAARLVHLTSGEVLERAAIEQAIDERLAAAEGGRADIRDLVGGPDRPLRLDAAGRPAGRGAAPQRPDIPVARPDRLGRR